MDTLIIFVSGIGALYVLVHIWLYIASYFYIKQMSDADIFGLASKHLKIKDYSYSASEWRSECLRTTTTYIIHNIVGLIFFISVMVLI